MSVTRSLQFQECARDIIGSLSMSAGERENRSTRTGTASDRKSPALSPIGERVLFNRFMKRVTELVNAGRSRLAFQEVENALDEGRFLLPSQQEALVLVSEGIRNVMSGADYPAFAAGELLAGGASLRNRFGLHAENSGTPSPALPVYGNTYGTAHGHAHAARGYALAA